MGEDDIKTRIETIKISLTKNSLKVQYSAAPENFSHSNIPGLLTVGPFPWTGVCNPGVICLGTVCMIPGENKIVAGIIKNSKKYFRNIISLFWQYNEACLVVRIKFP